MRDMIGKPSMADCCVNRISNPTLEHMVDNEQVGGWLYRFALNPVYGTQTNVPPLSGQQTHLNQLQRHLNNGTLVSLDIFT